MNPARSWRSRFYARSLASQGFTDLEGFDTTNVARTFALAAPPSPAGRKSPANAMPCPTDHRSHRSNSWRFLSLRLLAGLSLEVSHRRDHPPVYGLSHAPLRTDWTSPFLRLTGSSCSEVALDVEPVGPSAGSIEQDQDNRHLLQHPEVVIPDVQVESVIGINNLQRFCRLELQGKKVRFGVALLVEGKQEQIVAAVFLQPQRRAALVNDEPFR